MPLSNDNQDYGEKERKENTSGSENKQSSGNEQKGKLTSDDLKGKKVDADPEKESGKPTIPK